MADKKQPQKKKVTDLAKRALGKARKASDVKGGTMGPGTQTEDDIYVGVRKR
jgi:hypothetical protein